MHPQAHNQPIAIHQALGFSILELMIALALSLLLLAGVISIFVSSKSTYETVDRLSRVQENGRSALDQIITDIRSAGYPGCARAVKVWNSTLNSAATLPWNFDQTITGFEAQATSWSPSLDSSITGAVAGSDVLVLRTPRRGAVSVRLQSAMASKTAAVVIPNITPAPFASGDIVRIMSCEAQAIFQVTSYTAGTIAHIIGAGTPGNATSDLGYLFKITAEVVPVDTIVYYIRTGTNGSSLWRKIGTNAPEELVEGVDTMQITYGVNTNNDANNTADSYQTANDVTTNGLWGRVVSVQVSLLARSINEYGSNIDAKTYSMLGTNFGPYNDRRIREVFTATTSIRNRTP